MPARVIANFGRNLVVRTENGSLVSCFARKRLGLIVCGDFVEWSKQTDGSCVIQSVKKRESELARPDRQKNLKPLAANLQQIVVVLSPQPRPDWLMLTSYQLYAACHNIDLVILLNKVDTLTDQNRIELTESINIYKTIGLETIKISCKEKKGIRKLLSTFANKTSILVGQSGVGKSSIINLMLPDQAIQTTAISAATGLGSHTTTTTTLYRLPENGELIDSPGVRQFKIDYLDKDSVQDNFVEFNEFRNKCKFKNCNHLQEPGCAVHVAAEQGLISALRWQHYNQLMQ